MQETDIQKNSLTKFFIDEKDGLGYKEESPSIVSKDLFIKKDLLNFLKSSNNKQSFKWVLKRYFNNNEEEFYQEFKKIIKEKLNSPSLLNVSFLFNSEISFKGKLFTLFNKTSTLNDKYDKSHENIWTVVNEYTHIYYDKNGNEIKKEDSDITYSFRPDQKYFLNGIYFSYLELKFNSNGQNTDNAVQQIINKYTDSYELFQKERDKTIDINLKKEQKGQYKSKTLKLKKEFLRIFYSPIFVSAFDMEKLQTIRNFHSIENILEEKDTDLIYNKPIYNGEAKKCFSVYPNEDKNWKTMIRDLYSKESIEKEINYFNFSEKKFKEDKKKDEIGSLISPRPKQKFGIDKTLNIVKEMIEFEDDAQYWKDKIEDELREFPKDVQNKIIEERMKFKNNKYVNSILLSYATGFGKTNIIGWLSLFLKDFTFNNKPVFDTVYLVTDRLELKKQLDEKMRNMNVDKNVVQVVNNKGQFQSVLLNDYRIVIVNIQKFQHIKSSLTPTILNKLQNQRNVFIIDEVHRSNSGDQHNDMMTLFSNVLSIENSNKENNKKSLIIGLTATSNDDTLLRFGKFAGCTGEKVIYTAHDEYTMAESIKDGYTLDFSKNITPYSIVMNFKKSSDEETNTDNFFDENYSDDGTVIIEDYNGKKRKFSKKSIYENKDRIKAISEVVIKTLLSNVYNRIGVKGSLNQGKGILVAYSIEAAIQYHKYLSEYLEEKTKESEYSNYKDTKLYIVYSDPTNSDTKANVLNKKYFDKLLDEKTIIDRFKNDKNGLMIVVDKLLTGFDEPKLHTMFLDSEFTGIMAIQGPSRVNRTMNGKTDCHIIDFSHNNVNFHKNIPEALEKYSGSIYSESNVRSPYEELEISYSFIVGSQLFKKFFEPFNSLFYNVIETDKYLSLEKEIKNYIQKNEVISEKLFEQIRIYFRNYKLLKNIVDIKNFSDYKEITFFNKLFNLLKKETNNNVTGVEIVTEFEEINRILKSEEDYEESNIPPTNTSSGNSNGNENKEDIDSMIDYLNKKEAIKKEDIERYKNLIEHIFSKIIEESLKSESLNISVQYKDGSFSEEVLKNTFFDLYKKVKRRNKETITDEIVQLIEEDIQNNLYYLFIEYIETK